MKLTGEERADWSADELGAVLHHQLQAPLEYDLRTIAPGGEQTIAQMTAAIAIGPRPRSFADLIVHPSPPLELLTLMKDFARSGRDDGSIPAEVGTILYYAAIVLAIVRHNTRITKLDNNSLSSGIAWAAAVPWIDPALRQLFIEAATKL